MVKRKKIKSPKTLNLFGIKLEHKDYVENFIPEQEIWIKKIYKKFGLEWNFKPTTKQKSKYWDCKKIYPTTVSSFKEKFFKKRKPKRIEGVWVQYMQNQPAIYGVVKEGGAYQGYLIDVSWEIKAHTGSYLKDIFNHPGKTNYKLLNGTKFGAFLPDKKDPKKFKFKGISTIIGTLRKEENFPVNFELEYPVTNVDDYELRGDAEFLIKMEKYGLPRSAYKTWPEFKEEPIPGAYTAKKPGEPGYKEEINRGIQNEKDRNQVKEKNPSVGTGFFVSSKGHIITNFHVVRNSNSIKFLYNDDEVDAKLIESDQQLDLALLKSKVKNKNYIKFSNKSPQKAQNILVAGFPFGKAISSDLKITGGIINSLKGGGNDTTRLQIDATVNPGNSGGPIVDKVNGSLVGVAVAKLNKDFTKEVFGAEGENTNYGIKASQVRDFLESNNISVSVKSSKLKISELEESTVFIYNK